MPTRWITRLEILLSFALVLGCLGALAALGANVLIAGSLVSAVLGSASEAILSSMMLAESYAFHAPPSAVLGGVVAGFAALGVSEIVRRGLVLLQEVEATI
ncbi:hypothetical protein [Nonomuraea insulae]|uniref:Uncharacterized protein n=1 Tax=Nonomuraea insulae TaxID=1616787 RepID=A0ABW1D0K2_9ACTN